MKIIFPILVLIFSIFWWFIWSYVWENKQITHTKNSIASLENIIVDMVKNVSPSVVNVIINKDLMLYKSDPWWFFRMPLWSIEQKVWWWSGFFVDKNWTIITNKHVVSDPDAKYIVITNDWKELNAKVLFRDENNDVALLKVDYDSVPLKFIDSENDIKTGNFAVAIWNALWELQNSVSLWIISWKNRDLWDIWLKWLLQTDASINPWNSWWPLINTNWKVMWINTAIINNSEWLGFAIPLDQQMVDKILNNL